MEHPGVSSHYRTIALPCSLNSHRRVDPHAQDGSLRQIDLLAFGGGDRATGANQDAGQRALEATEYATEDGADAGPGPDAAAFAPDPFTFDRPGDGTTNGIRRGR